MSARARPRMNAKPKQKLRVMQDKTVLGTGPPTLIRYNIPQGTSLTASKSGIMININKITDLSRTINKSKQQ